MPTTKYRAVVYLPGGASLKSSAVGYNAADTILVRLVGGGIATGGHIEERVKGQGWVLSD